MGTGYVSGGGAVYADETPDRIDLRDERDEIDINEVPGVIYQKKYDEDHRGLYKQIQHISDHILMKGPSVFAHGNPNTPKCRAVYAGQIDPNDYDTALNTFGAPGVADIKDYGLMYTFGQRLVSNKLTNPYRFSIKDVSPKAREKALNEMIDRLTEQAVRVMTDTLQQQSQADGKPADFSFLKNPNVNPAAPNKKGEPTLEEKVLNSLLRDSILRYNTLDEMRLALKDKIQLNAQAGHVEVQGDDVFFVRDEIENIGWIAPGRIRTAEDCSAIGLKDYMTLPEIYQQYGHLFGSRGMAASLAETVKKLRGGNILNYHPRVYQLTDGRDNRDVANFITQQITETGEGFRVWENMNWQHSFYPWDVNDSSIISSTAPLKILRHRLYFRVIKYLPSRILINGKTPTDKQWQQYQHRNYNRDMDITIERLKEDEKPQRGDFVQKIPFVEAWQATRLGHNLLIDVGKCTNAPRDLRQPKKILFPVILSVNYEKGIVAMALEFVRLWNTLWNRIDELILLLGTDDVTWIDEVQMSPAEALTLRHSVRKVGFAFYNSQKLQDRTNPMAQKHLTTTRLGNNEAKVKSLFELAGLIEMTLEKMLGPADPSQSNYDSSSKLQFRAGQQASLTQQFYYEDTLFNNQALQRVSEIQRMVAAKDDWASVQYLGTGGVRLTRNIKLTKSLADTWPVVDLADGPKMAQIQRDLEAVATQAMASGTTGIREVVKLKFAQDAMEALDIFDSGLTVLEQINAQQAQQAQQIQQAKAQSDAQRVQMPLMVEEQRGKNELAAIAAKQEGKQDELDFKGQMADTEEQWARERNVQENALNKDQEAFTQNVLPPEWTNDAESS
jgi:hypothetical protein